LNRLAHLVETIVNPPEGNVVAFGKPTETVTVLR
jgi:hypothetical protein